MNIKNKGFTLIELLVVISIIGMLSSVVLGSLNTARASARDSARIQAILQVKNALEVYRTANGKYPITKATLFDYNDANWDAPAAWGGNLYQPGMTELIPGLVPTYISKISEDPGDKNRYGYFYISNGDDYFFEAWNVLEKPRTTGPFYNAGLDTPDTSLFVVSDSGFMNTVISNGLFFF